VALSQEETDRMRFLELKRKRAGGGEEAALPKALSTVEKIQGWGEQANRGLFLGWGDELAGALRAGGDLLSSDYDFGEGVVDNPRSLGDAYSAYRDEARDVGARFEEAHPLISGATTLATSFISPINKIPGARGAATSGERVLSQLIRSGAEGAAVGLGEGEGTLEEQLSSAKSGAKWGAGTNLALKSLGAVGQKTGLTDWIGEKLFDEAGNFIPIHMASEGKIANFLRNTAGRTTAGGEILGGQEKRIIDAASERVERARTDLAGRKLAERSRTRAEQGDIRRQQDYDVAQETRSLEPVPAGVPAADGSG